VVERTVSSRSTILCSICMAAFTRSTKVNCARRSRLDRSAPWIRIQPLLFALSSTWR
jgi:hypothetical protein